MNLAKPNAQLGNLVAGLTAPTDDWSPGEGCNTDSFTSFLMLSCWLPEDHAVAGTYTRGSLISL